MSLIVVLVLTVAFAQQPSPSELRAEAERLARQGNHAEALKRFQVLTSANPDDIESRIWIGRLHMEMGHSARAAAVFESIVAAMPQNVDALAGLAEAQMDLGRWSDASRTLAQAEKLASDRIDVLAAHGRFHGANRRATLALAYYDRALAAEPDNDRIRTEANVLRAARAHRAEIRYDLQAFRPDAGEMHAGSFEVNARVTDALRVFGRAQVQDFEDTSEGRGGGGIEWFVHRAVRIRAGGLFADGTWLPSSDIFGQVEFSQRNIRATFGARSYDFEGADLWLVGPGLAIDLNERVKLRAEYLRGRTEFAPGFSEGSNNATLGADAALTPRFTASFDYRRGIDYPDWMTADRVTATGANTFSFGGRYASSPLLHFAGAYDHQDRDGPGTVHRARAWVGFGF